MQQCGDNAASRLLYATSADKSADMNCSKLATSANLWLMAVPPTTMIICVNNTADCDKTPIIY